MTYRPKPDALLPDLSPHEELVLLARTLTRPLRELTAATQAMARGTFDHRVTVRNGSTPDRGAG